MIGARAMQLPIPYSFINYSAKIHPVYYMPVFSTGNAKINNMTPA